jgi:hypothetical protein
MNQFWYLSIPYSFNPELSFAIANEVTANLMIQGKIIYSPITHNHLLIDLLPSELNNHDFWMNFDLTMLRCASGLYVVSLGSQGERLIQQSVGVQLEISEAQQLNLPIEIYKYNEFSTRIN